MGTSRGTSYPVGCVPQAKDMHPEVPPDIAWVLQFHKSTKNGLFVNRLGSQSVLDPDGGFDGHSSFAGTSGKSNTS